MSSWAAVAEPLRAEPRSRRSLVARATAAPLDVLTLSVSLLCQPGSLNKKLWVFESVTGLIVRAPLNLPR